MSPSQILAGSLKDPLRFAKVLWPDVEFYREQRQIIYSVRDNDETYCCAGNMLGKDFVAGFIALWFFLTRTPCRVVTTSVDGTQLESVLWGEIRRFIQTARIPLDHTKGGPLIVNHLHLRKVLNGVVDGLSYCIGRVAAKGEGMLGHHIADTGDGIPRTLFIADEASGVEDESYRRSETWARRKLIIGNPYPCTNFFKAGVRAGDLLDPHYRLPSADDSSIPQAPHERYYRKVIRIRGEDSPNVRVALGRMSVGLPPESAVGGGSPVVLPGVLPYPDYRKRRETWDEIMQTIGLDALFYEGAEVLLYPPLWLDRAHRIAEAIDRGDKALLTGKYRRAEAIGIDPGEGGADTALCVIDHQGIIDMIAHKTPDTSDITDLAIEYMRVYDVPDHRVVFDRGGGGKQHADRMRRMGHKRIRTVAFGESVNVPLRRSRVMFEEKLDVQEERYAYKNRRAEMYGRLRELLDPVHEEGFGIPRNLQELRRQLAPIPLMFDPEGRLELPPKDKKDPDSKVKTLKEILGCSPDQADALVLAVHALFAKSIRPRAGSI